MGTIHHYYYRTTQTPRQDMVLAGDCVNAIVGLAAQAVAQTDWLGERSTPIIPRLQTGNPRLSSQFGERSTRVIRLLLDIAVAETGWSYQSGWFCGENQRQPQASVNSALDAG